MIRRLLLLPLAALALSGASFAPPAAGPAAFWAPRGSGEGPAEAAEDDPGSGALCHRATAQAERETGVPDQLLTAISRVESGVMDAATGRREAWPWSINVEGAGHVFGSKAQAITAVQAARAAGARSIDVGCLQVNLLQHPDAFASLDEAFDPLANARYGARFLLTLFGQTGSWPHAAAAYHSQTPGIGEAYQTQVLDAWADGDGARRRPPRPATRARTETASLGTNPAPFPSGPLGFWGAPPSREATEALAAVSGSMGHATQGPASAGAVPSAASPFTASMPAGVQRYGPAVPHLPPGIGRDLAAYRTMPIAASVRRFAGRRF